KIKPFLSAEAFVPSGKNKWDVIDKKTVQKLKTKSLARIKKDPEFKKIVDDIEKAKKKKNSDIVLSEFVKDKEDANKEIDKLEGKNYEETQAVKKEKYMERADIQEALNVARD